MQDNERVVVRWIDEPAKVPACVRALVDGYKKRQQVAVTCAAYPRQVDQEMNVLFDAMNILAGEVEK